MNALKDPPDRSWLEQDEMRTTWIDKLLARFSKPQGNVRVFDAVPFGTVRTQGEELDALEMLQMARKHVRWAKGSEKGVAICLEAALLELQRERLQRGGKG